ncbi:hypothetical protein [Streptococcus massiliensis]|uniref:Uncharacterized protein n=1 Tax=Streptococcus massiliensis TaxID=313439 RepID=A0A380KXC3_9STRE|nr:hypothetical protein [Streptococcus massiliensis]SUN76603.1 Uncharacterised protein [Streptococcus massiliensis]
MKKEDIKRIKLFFIIIILAIDIYLAFYGFTHNNMLLAGVGLLGMLSLFINLKRK